MPSLGTLQGKTGAFGYVKSAELVGIPSLVSCELPYPFFCINDMWIENAPLLEEKRTGLLRDVTKAAITNMDEWNAIEQSIVQSITVPASCCNESEFCILDLSEFKHLREFKVGDECFMYVKKVVISGLKRLESIQIGGKCFTKEKTKWVCERDGQFHVKDCPSLKELIISGVRSFSDYSVCEIENTPSLTVIIMGVLNEKCCCFHSASLELKGMAAYSGLFLDMPCLKSILFGGFSFRRCSRIAFISEVLIGFLMTRLTCTRIHSTGMGITGV